jgi:hypothetical protein
MHAWILTKREENQLLVFERKVLETLCGSKQENDMYRRISNFELEREFNSPRVINVLRSVGHMIRRPEYLP